LGENDFVPVLLLWMVPEVYMLSVALRSPDTAFNPQLFSFPITIDNFITVIRENPLLTYFWNSLVVTCGTVVIVLGAAALFAFAASVLRLRATTLLYTSLLTTLMIPMASIVLPIAIMLRTAGWINTYQGLILPYGCLSSLAVGLGKDRSDGAGGPMEYWSRGSRIYARSALG
jgi:raffinose/stachyose/melibiose transport system permease protein